MINKILSNFEAKRNENNESIKKLEHNNSLLVNKLTKELSEFYTKNPDVQISFLDIKNLSNAQKNSLLIKVLEVRNLNENEISFDLLRLIEISNKKSKIVEQIFKNADKKLKLRIASFCSGISTIGYQYDFIKNYLKDEYNLTFEYSNDSNNIVASNFNPDTNQFGLKISTTKNSEDFLDSIVKTIHNLILDGFKNEVIEIFERSLCQYQSYYLRIHDEDGTLVIPEIITSSRYNNNIFVGVGNNFEEQLKSCLIFITKNIYYNCDDDCDDDEDC